MLYYPPYDGPPLSAPLCLLALASPLLDAGYEVRVIDAAVTPHPEAAVARELEDALCLGISVLTGPMIRGAIKIAQASKRARPELPVIFGGWHPSLTPDQTLLPDYVDYVVRGQGELTMLELVERFAAGKSAEGTAGLSLKRGTQIVHECERPMARLDDLPAPAYHLADYDAYARACGVRKLSYATSVGCPYACHYCTDQVFYKRRFNAYPAERVVREMCDLAERYRIEEIALLDSNFPVDVHRAVAIARGIYDSGIRFRWTFQASTDFLCRMSQDEVRLLAESGVTHMGFGTESTSKPVLVLMNKKHQHTEDIVETARRAELAGIHVTFNLIFGYPGETEQDRIETLHTMSDIARRFWNVSFSPNIFTPYPGIPIWPMLRSMGVREPQTLEEWIDLPLGRNVLPWLGGEELARLRRMLEYFLLNNDLRKVTKHSPLLRRGIRRALGAPRRYSFPWELWVRRAVAGITTRRSLVTGQQLSQSMRDVC